MGNKQLFGRGATRDAVVLGFMLLFAAVVSGLSASAALAELAFAGNSVVNEAVVIHGSTKTERRGGKNKSTHYYADLELARADGASIRLTEVEIAEEEFADVQAGRVEKIALRHDATNPKDRAESEAYFQSRPIWVWWLVAGVGLIVGVVVVVAYLRARRRRLEAAANPA
jgi:hypothetical protein